MSNLKEKVEVAGATVDFYKFIEDGIEYYEFDTSKSGPPEPMVNAMAGLKMIDSPNKKLIMINHKKPMGLLDKIGVNYNITDEKMEDGRVKLIFSYKDGESEKADLTQTSCGG